MAGKRYSPERIIRKLRAAEVLISQGMVTAERQNRPGYGVDLGYNPVYKLKIAGSVHKPAA